MTISQALTWAIEKLKNVGIASANLDSEILLSFILKKSKEFFYTYPESRLSSLQLKQFKQLIKRRTNHEPVAYLINNKNFYGLDFYVDHRVLVPRPETEMLIDEVLNLNKDPKPVIADIGTGSGNIAITLAKKMPDAILYATDISTEALDVAKHNAKEHRVKINFIEGDLMEPLMEKPFDIIIANLPYVTTNRHKEAKELHHEPVHALIAANKGMSLYEKLFKQLKKYKFAPDFIILEIGENHSDDLKKIAEKHFPNVRIKKDLAGLDRILIIN